MPRKLLLADDSVTIQKVVAIVFAHEDFEVTTVANGEDAIARARELRPDVVLADVVMPGKDGYQVCEALKADPATRNIPVLLLAGTFEPFDEARADAAGADGHMPKPFESARLLDKVRQLVDGQRSASAPAAVAAAAPATAARPPVSTSVAAPPRSPVAPAAPSPFATAASAPRSPAAAPAPQTYRPAPSSAPAPSWTAAPRPPSSVILPPRPAAPATAAPRPSAFATSAGTASGSRPASAAPPPASTNVAQPPPPNRAVPPGLAAGRSAAGEDPFARALASPSAPAPLGVDEDELLLDVEEDFELADEATIEPAPVTAGPKASSASGALEITAAGDSARPFASSDSGRRPLPEAELAPVSRPAAAAPSAFGGEAVAQTAELVAGEPVQPLDLSELDALSAGPVSPEVFDELPAPPEEKSTPGAVLLGSPVDTAFERPAGLPKATDAASFLAAADEAPAARVAAPASPARTPAPLPAADATSGDGGEAALRTAISAASREVVEKIAWEVVPQLAEVIIREHLERLIEAREGSGKL